MAYLNHSNHLGAAARENLHRLGGIPWREKKTKEEEEEEERAKETEEKRIRSIVRKMAPLQATSERKSQEMEGERQRTRGTKPKRKLRNRFRYFSSEISPIPRSPPWTASLPKKMRVLFFFEWRKIK